MPKPTTYREDYCQQMIDYFNRPLTKEIQVETQSAKGEIYTKTIIEPNNVPTFHQFAQTINSDNDTMNAWCQMYDMFRVAKKKCTELQQWFIAQNALSNKYNANMSKFVLQNVSDWREKSTTDLNVKGTVSLTAALDQALDQKQTSIKPSTVKVIPSDNIVKEDTIESENLSTFDRTILDRLN